MPLVLPVPLHSMEFEKIPFFNNASNLFPNACNSKTTATTRIVKQSMRDLRLSQTMETETKLLLFSQKTGYCFLVDSLYSIFGLNYLWREIEEQRSATPKRSEQHNL